MWSYAFWNVGALQCRGPGLSMTYPRDLSETAEVDLSFQALLVVSCIGYTIGYSIASLSHSHTTRSEQLRQIYASRVVLLGHTMGKISNVGE